MKRDPINLAQIALFEPDAAEALRQLTAHAARFERALEAADRWEACWLPGARDEALRQADDAFALWLVCAIFLDLERCL